MPKSTEFQNNGKNDLSLGDCTPPRGTIFLSEILMLVSSISFLSMVKKPNGFFMGKIQFSKIIGQKS